MRRLNALCQIEYFLQTELLRKIFQHNLKHSVFWPKEYADLFSGFYY